MPPRTSKKELKTLKKAHNKKAQPKKGTKSHTPKAKKSKLLNIRRATKGWTQQEDLLLIRLLHDAEWVDAKPRWTEIAEHIPNRKAKQCRERWINNLRPDIKDGKWDDKEDLLLVSLQLSLGNKWTDIAKVLNRSENSVKNHWHSKRHVAFRNNLSPSDVHFGTTAELLLEQASVEKPAAEPRPPLKIDGFGPPEDLLLYSLQKSIGNKWAAIAKILNRDESSTKNRWNSTEHIEFRRNLPDPSAISERAASEVLPDRTMSVEKPAPTTTTKTTTTLDRTVATPRATRKPNAVSCHHNSGDTMTASGAKKPPRLYVATSISDAIPLVTIEPSPMWGGGSLTPHQLDIASLRQGFQDYGPVAHPYEAFRMTGATFWSPRAHFTLHDVYDSAQV